VLAQLGQILAHGGGRQGVDVLVAETLKAIAHALKMPLVRAGYVPPNHLRTHVRIMSEFVFKINRKTPLTALFVEPNFRCPACHPHTTRQTAS
jgi:hypothetical protein